MLLNPAVIIEVLSPSTEAFDRGEKWSRYQTWLPSLSSYILASQSKPEIECFLRQPNGGWMYRRVKGLDRTFGLELIRCTLRLSELYQRIVFQADPPEQLD